MKKFNELYKLIMEDFVPDRERNAKYWNLLRQIKSAPSQQVLTNIYENNKDFIDNNEHLIRALLKNANSTEVFKNQFRNCEFQNVQDWFKIQDGEYDEPYMTDADWDNWNDLTKGECEHLTFY